nr:MAK10-like protein [Tanacetum cinerariifolium]
MKIQSVLLEITPDLSTRATETPLSSQIGTMCTSDRHLIELEIQVQRLMEAHLAPKSSVQVNKISSSCEICSGPHATQYYMENLEQAFVDDASSRTNKAGGKWYNFKPEQNNLGEPIRNSSSLKCVHFVNTIIILSKEDEPRKTEIVKQVTKDNDHESIFKVEEKSKESEGKKGEEKDDPE